MSDTMRRTAPPLLVLIALLPASASADDPGQAALRAAVDELAQPVIRESQAIGIVVGVITPDAKLVAGYGRKSAASDEQPDGDTLFEIGSVTKVFTGLCLADMVQEEIVAMDSRIEECLPASVRFEHPLPRPITLRHLATHTSGLPRIPLVLAFANPADPYAKYNEELLVQLLNDYEWPEDAGTKFAYSNLGMGMLGWLLARRDNTTYEQLVVRRICEPLELQDTRITLSDDQRQRLAPGHTPEGEPAGNWSFDVLAGAGAFYSTTEDLLRFAAANLKPDTGVVPKRLAAAIALSQKPHADTDDSHNAIGLGWMIRKSAHSGRQFLWHNGATGAYTSFLGIVPERGIAVVVLSNTGMSDTGHVGDRLGGTLLESLRQRAGDVGAVGGQPRQEADE